MIFGDSLVAGFGLMREDSFPSQLEKNLLSENYDIISPFITKIYNDSKSNTDFPDHLKYADITPAHKKDETTIKDNYSSLRI